MDGVEGSRSTSTSAMLTNSARARAFGWVAARNFVRRLGALGVDVGVSGYSAPVAFVSLCSARLWHRWIDILALLLWSRQHK